MAFNFNGVELTKVTLDGVELDKCTLDSIEVFNSTPPLPVHTNILTVGVFSSYSGWWSGRMGALTPTSLYDSNRSNRAISRLHTDTSFPDRVYLGVVQATSDNREFYFTVKDASGWSSSVRVTLGNFNNWWYVSNRALADKIRASNGQNLYIEDHYKP